MHDSKTRTIDKETHTMKNIDIDQHNGALRNTTARILAPVMKLTGYRFPRACRRGDTLTGRIVYMLIDTVAANVYADIHKA